MKCWHCLTAPSSDTNISVVYLKQLPVPVLLMYGQKKGFKHGDADPSDMLRLADSDFVPTRSAWLVAAAIDSGAQRLEDVVYLYLQLRGFVSPDAPVVGELVAALEAADSLPFGDKLKQYAWIMQLPSCMAAKQNQLVSDDQNSWACVVDKLIMIPTQFENDVFWRVRGLHEFRGGVATKRLELVDRATNARGHAVRWQRDFVLNESKRYAVEIQTYSPEAHGNRVPGNSSIAITSQDDDESLIRLSADPLEIVPNQLTWKRFSISTDSAVDTRYSGLHLETQLPNHTSAYPAGSLCSLTFSIRKQRWRMAFGIFLISVSAAIGGYTAVVKPGGWSAAALAVAALLSLSVGGWFLTQQFKLWK
jgi:hypothetical protein